ncbi:hypothetical protein [Deinococcus indicus]|uniref:hypothetical protein n=1 Tax=Deinococcus indicus TaxID=223556 RepID=UPI00117769DA|nr:hypothetical protein [Deinococcus indicus]
MHRGTARPPRNIVDFGAFVTLFPHLVAGPILRFHLLADQFRERTHTAEKFALGAQRVMIGLSMKVLLADPLAPLVEAAYTAQRPSAADAWLGSVAYRKGCGRKAQGFNTGMDSPRLPQGRPC